MGVDASPVYYFFLRRFLFSRRFLEPTFRLRLGLAIEFLLRIFR